MTGLPDGTSDRPSDLGQRLLRDVAATFDLAGAMFLKATFTSPWALESPPGPDLAGALRPGSRRVILMHVVTEGSFTVQMANGHSTVVGPGDVVILPYADQHLMRGTVEADPTPIGSLFPPQPWTEMPDLRYGGGGDPTSIVCGYLYGDAMDAHPVLAAMPPLMPVRTGGGELTEWLLTNLRFAMAGCSGSPMSEVLRKRLPELMFLECVARYLAQTEGPLAEGGCDWLAAATDPVVGAALGAIHDDPAQPWTLAKLTRACAASRSVLEERFSRLVGCPPMQYVTAWRIQLAARALRSSERSVAEIADAVGYSSTSGFSRAFKRRLGLSPAAWRSAAPAG